MAQRRQELLLRRACLLAALTLFVARAISALPQTDFTVGLLEQQLSVYRQVLRIPAGFFARRACQVAYLGSPDWAAYELGVDFVSGTEQAVGTAACGSPQLYFAYVDGYDAPSHLSYSISASSDGAPWAVAMFGAKTRLPPPAPPSPSSPQQRRRGRSLSAISVTNPRSMFTSSSASFSSAFDNVRQQADALQELLNRGDDIGPGPEGTLRKPVLASNRRTASVGQESLYLAGELPPDADDLDPSSEGGPPAPPSSTPPAVPLLSVLSDSVLMYAAPEADCLAAMRKGGRARKAAAVSTTTASAAPTGYESCYVTQLVVYVYQNCSTAATAAATQQQQQQQPPEAAGAAPPRAQLPPHPRATTLRGAAEQGLEAALAKQAAALGLDLEATGYVELSVLYSPYTACSNTGFDTLADLSLQVSTGCTGLLGRGARGGGGRAGMWRRPRRVCSTLALCRCAWV